MRRDGSEINLREREREKESQNRLSGRPDQPSRPTNQNGYKRTKETTKRTGERKSLFLLSFYLHHEQVT